VPKRLNSIALNRAKYIHFLFYQSFLSLRHKQSYQSSMWVNYDNFNYILRWIFPSMSRNIAKYRLRSSYFWLT